MQVGNIKSVESAGLQEDQAFSPRGFQAAVEADNVVLSQDRLFQTVGIITDVYHSNTFWAAIFTCSAIVVATWLFLTLRSKSWKGEGDVSKHKGNVAFAKGHLREHIKQVYSILLAHLSKDVIEGVIHPNVVRRMQEHSDERDSSDARTSREIEVESAFVTMVKEVIVTELDEYCTQMKGKHVMVADQEGVQEPGTMKVDSERQKCEELISSVGIENKGKNDAMKNLNMVMQGIVKSMNINIEAMNDEGKLALLQTSLQAINTENQSRELEISSSSLKLQGGMFNATLSQNTILEESNYIAEEKNTLSLKKLVQIEKQHKLNERIKAVASFKASCADTLLGGLIIMVIAMLPRISNLKLMIFQALEKCHVKSSGLLLLDVIPAVSISICFIRTMLMRVGGYALSFYIVVNILQYGALRNYQATPVTCLFLIMGVLCGQIGKSAIYALGGNGEVWFYCWLALCTTHCLVLLFSEKLLVWLWKKTKDRKRYISIKRACFYAILLFILPVACGVLPFIL